MPGGRPKHRVYESPETLEEASWAYFEWCDNNPWLHNEALKGGGRAGEIIQVPTSRPYTIIAMCHHIGISTKTWYNYEKVEEFLHITTHIHEKIRNQKYEGAVVGAFNANIIARDLGLTDKQDHTHTGDIKFTGIEIQAPSDS